MGVENEANNATPTPPQVVPSQLQRQHPYPRDWLRNLLRRHNPGDSSFDEIDPILANKAFVVAPMVDQSDLPFRLLCRRHGANLAYTPMIHARLFAEKKEYRKKFCVRDDVAEDRPLIAQFCGHDPEIVLEAATFLQNHGGIDAVDLNCGCPQNIARRGKYGAFLLEKPDSLLGVVKTLTANLTVPVCVKVRLLPSGLEDSLALYEQLVDAGISLLTVHGRTRFQKAEETGPADWDAIRMVVDRLGDRIPIIANGSIGNMDDVRECLRQTNADGVMSSEAILEYPPVFTQTNTAAVQYRRTGPGRVELAREYLNLSREYPPDCGGQGSGIKCVRVHIHRFLHADLQCNAELRDKVAYGCTYEDLENVIDRVEEIHKSSGHIVQEEQLSWYVRHRAVDENGVNLSVMAKEKTRRVEQAELDDDAAECFASMFGEDDEDDDEDGEVCG